MKLVFFILFIAQACNKSEKTQFSTIEIKDSILNEYIREFISFNENNKKESEIVISSQIRNDTTVFYLIAGVKPDFEKAQVLGCAYIGKMLIWLQGEKPEERFITIINHDNEEDKIVDTVNGKGEVIKKHPLQWVIKFKGDKFIKCRSNLDEECKLQCQTEEFVFFCF